MYHYWILLVDWLIEGLETSPLLQQVMMKDGVPVTGPSIFAITAGDLMWKPWVDDWGCCWTSLGFVVFCISHKQCSTPLVDDQGDYTTLHIGDSNNPRTGDSDKPTSTLEMTKVLELERTSTKIHTWPWLLVISGYFYGIKHFNYEWWYKYS